ncbi:MAG: carbohydrate ABC transporter permease, partial [Chloroflexi bacterium]|nr:carbohydrate ABC transporter permease [Chloroflexota bacterium]
WMILTSFKTYEESIRIPLTFLPGQWNLTNYSTVWHKFPFLNFYINTFIVMVVVIVGELFISSMAAYAFARLNFPFRNAIFVFCLSLMMMPGQIFLIPQYDLMVKAGLNNTIIALILPRLFSVFSVFMLRQFFLTLPTELDDAAKIDGCGFFGIYFRILLPLVKPALISMAILSGLSTWKDLIWPLIVNNSMDKYTLSAGLALLIGEHTTIYPNVMAGSFLAVWPMILLFFLAQKHFVEGIAFSGIKG